MPDSYKPLNDEEFADAADTIDGLDVADCTIKEEIAIQQMTADARYHRQRCADLEQWVNDLQSGMYINCVYCGHRYGPNTEMPASMADVLKAHVEQCSSHPMSALKLANADLERRLNVEATVSAYDRDESGCHVLMPIPDFIRENPRCFYRFDATHVEYGIDSQARQCFQIDAGVAFVVQLLWDAGIPTTGCCDGHGSGDGVVGIATLDDGSPHGSFNDHDPYRPVIHSAERRAVHALERKLADATSALEAIVNIHGRDQRVRMSRAVSAASTALAKLREQEA